jgi:hypothetical protein
LERLEKQRYRERIGDDMPLLKERLRPPLQPPKEPLAFGIGLGTFIGIMVLISALNFPHGLFSIVLALLATIGVFHFLKQRYEEKFAVWRLNAKGAHVCLKCSACFHPKIK